MHPTFGEEGSFFLGRGDGSENFTAVLVDNLHKNGKKFAVVVLVTQVLLQ